MILNRMSTVEVRASTEKSSPSRLQVFRKKVESARSPLLKENFNKLTFIATAEAKFVSDTLNELDKIHKDLFEKQWGKKKEGSSQVDSKEAEVVEADGEGENIFLKK